MRRLTVALMLAVILVPFACSVSWSVQAQGATPAATTPQPPRQPTTGPGSTEARFSGVTAIEQKQPHQFIADYWLFVPRDPLSGSTTAEPYPLVIFVHGLDEHDPAAYLAWIEHLVRRGAVVLYPEYQTAVNDDEAAFGQTLRDVVGSALENLSSKDVDIDVTRVAVVGHSVGGVLAVDYAASAAAAGLPVPSAVMGVGASCPTEELACLSADLAAIPATTRVLLVTGDNDDPTVPATVARLWSGMSAVPTENRDIITLVSDTHGKPWLLATHAQAFAGNVTELDAHDWYGTWKWLDALMGCAFDGEWCEVALGNTPEQRFMGEWSDGVPVAEPLVTDDPA
jgi:acetyl esterase/lipase